MKYSPFVWDGMSTQSKAVWVKHHAADGDVTRLDVTGLWTTSIPGFVRGAAEGEDVYLERKGEKTFLVTE